jgi:hypothetical protein
MGGKYGFEFGDFGDIGFAGTEHKVTFFDHLSWGRAATIEGTYKTPGALEYASDLVSGIFRGGVSVPTGKFKAGNGVTGYSMEFDLDPHNAWKHLSDDYSLPSGTHIASVSL